MDDGVGGIYLHASKDSAPTYGSEEEESLQHVPPKMMSSTSDNDDSFGRDYNLHTASPPSSSAMLLNGNASNSNDKDSLSETSHVALHSMTSDDSSGGTMLREHSADPTLATAQPLDVAGSFLESDVSTALEALVQVDSPLHLDDQDVGTPLLDNALEKDMEMDRSTPTETSSAGFCPVDGEVAKTHDTYGTEQLGSDVITLSSAVSLTSSESFPGWVSSQNTLTSISESFIPVRQLTKQTDTSLETKHDFQANTKSSPDHGQSQDVVIATSSKPNCPPVKATTSEPPVVGHSTINSQSLDPASQRSLKQRQKIHNIVDRLRIGAHVEPSVHISTQALAGSLRALQNSISQSVPTYSKPSGVTTGDQKATAYRIKQDAGNQTVFKSLAKQHVVNASTSIQPPQSGRSGMDGSGLLGPRLQSDNQPRQNDFPQVMIKDVFSQSTGKRLIQRSQAIQGPLQGAVSPAGHSQLPSTNTSMGSGLLMTQSDSSTSPLLTQTPASQPGNTEDPVVVQQGVNGSEQTGSQAPREGNMHLRRSQGSGGHEGAVQGVPRGHSHWGYSSMPNPITSLQHFVNQPNPSLRPFPPPNKQLIASGRPLAPMPVGHNKPGSQGTQAVVDLSTVQYGPPDSPVALSSNAPDQPMESDLAIPRLQLISTSQPPSQPRGHSRVAGGSYTPYRYAGGSSAGAGGAGGTYQRQTQQPPRHVHVVPPNLVTRVQVPYGSYDSRVQGGYTYPVVSPDGLMERGSGHSPNLSGPGKAMYCGTAVPGGEYLGPERGLPYPVYDKIPYGAGDVPRHLQNIHLPLPLPNFGGFMSTQGLSGAGYDSVSGYLVVPIKKLKDSACQTDGRYPDGDLNHSLECNETMKASVGVQVQTRTFLCASCLTEADLEEAVQEKVVPRIEYQCKLCMKQFPSVSKLQNHKSKAHNMRLPFRCGECSIRFEDHASVVKHLASHTDDTTCETCSKVFQSKDILERHKRLHKSPSHVCRICAKPCHSGAALLKHMEELHLNEVDRSESDGVAVSEVNNNLARTTEAAVSDGQGESIPAVTGRSASKDPAQVASRARSVSLDSASDFGDHYCHFCQIQFATDKYLLNHYLSYHRKGYGFQCPVCPRYVHLWSRLKKHIKDHGLSAGVTGPQEGEDPNQFTRLLNENPQAREPARNPLFRKTVDGRWECLTCGEGFYSEVRVKNHLGTVHDERLYQCTLCKLMFPHSTHLYWHMRDHKRKGHISEIPAKFVSQTQSFSASNASYKCKHCPEEFFLEKHLSNHLGQKHGYKVFSCQICGEKFNYSNRLIMHMKSHSKRQRARLVNTRQVTRNGLFTLPDARSGTSTVENANQLDNAESDFGVTTGDEGTSDAMERQESGLIKTPVEPFQNGFVYLCGFCNEGFAEEADFRTHMQSHQRGKKLNCRVCGERFSSWLSLQEHTKNHPSGARKRNLETSTPEGDQDEAFDEDGSDADDDETESDNLWTSAFVEDGSMSQGGVGPGRISRSSGTSLARRNSSTGYEYNPVGCPVCLRRFKTKPGRRVHLKTAHQINGMRHYIRLKQKIKSRTLICPICVKSFRNPGGTRLHLQNVHGFSLLVMGKMLRGEVLNEFIASGVRAPSSSVDDAPNSPPGLQKLIISKAKGQNTHTVTPADETSSTAPRTEPHLLKSPSVSGIPSKNTAANQKTDKDFQCPHCDQLSFSAKGIRSHMTRVHYMEPKINNTWTTCNACNRCFYNSARLTLHQTEVHGMKEDFQCPGCTAVYERYPGMYTHMRRKHPNIKWRVRNTWVSCKHCGRMFYDEQKRDSHIRSNHAPTTSSARKTGKTLPSPPHSPITLPTDVNPARGKIGYFHCPRCPKMVVTIKGIQVHILKRHHDLPIKKWQLWKGCKRCGQYYFDDVQLGRHLKECRTQKETPKKAKYPALQPAVLQEPVEGQDQEVSGNAGGFQCPHCNEWYGKFRGVDAHMRQTHSLHNRKREPDWSICSICEGHYYSAEALQLHMDKVHKDGKLEASTADIDFTAQDADVSGEVSIDFGDENGTIGFQCPKCFVVIPSIKGMQVHMFRTHSRVKRKRWQDWSRCKQCDLRFYEKGLLWQHVAKDHREQHTLASSPEKSADLSEPLGMKQFEAFPAEVSDVAIGSGFRCPKCTHMCSKFGGIDTHLRVKHGFRNIHGRKYWITCHKCMFYFYDEHAISAHVMKEHNGDFSGGEDFAIVSEGPVDAGLKTSQLEQQVEKSLRSDRISTSTPRLREGKSLTGGITPAAVKDATTLIGKQSGLKAGKISGFECPYCYNSYPKYLGVDAHIRQKHYGLDRKPLPSWVSCDLCLRMTCDVEALKQHKQRHLATDSQDLTQSSQVEDPSDSGTRLDKSNGDDGSTRLNLSNNTTIDSMSVLELDKFRRGIYNCPLCSNKTSYKGIGVHLAKSHKGAPRKSGILWSCCSVCSQYFYDDSTMEQHVADSHMVEDLPSETPAEEKNAAGEEITAAKENSATEGNIDSQSVLPPVIEEGLSSAAGTVAEYSDGVFHCPACQKTCGLCRSINAHIHRQHKRISTQSASNWKQCSHCNGFFYNEACLEKHKKEVHDSGNSALNGKVPEPTSEKTKPAAYHSLAQDTADTLPNSTHETDGTTEDSLLPQSHSSGLIEINQGSKDDDSSLPSPEASEDSVIQDKANLCKDNDDKNEKEQTLLVADHTSHSETSPNTEVSVPGGSSQSKDSVDKGKRKARSDQVDPLPEPKTRRTEHSEVEPLDTV